ncbi:hypothetical protein TNCV_199941 [Trichonephila clavipes]|nr:hypothetical protein TNCV_199941 [Trichonephila clavipes]
MGKVSRCRTRSLAPVHSRERLGIRDQRSSGYRESEIEIGSRRELTREKRLFTCWLDRDGENEWSLPEDLVIQKNCEAPKPSR